MVDNRFYFTIRSNTLVRTCSYYKYWLYIIHKVLSVSTYLSHSVSCFQFCCNNVLYFFTFTFNAWLYALITSITVINNFCLRHPFNRVHRILTSRPTILTRLCYSIARELLSSYPGTAPLDHLRLALNGHGRRNRVAQRRRSFSRARRSRSTDRSYNSYRNYHTT